MNVNNTQVTFNILCLIASEIWGCHRGTAGEPRHQGCYVLPTGKQLHMFRRVVQFLFEGVGGSSGFFNFKSSFLIFVTYMEYLTCWGHQRWCSS